MILTLCSNLQATIRSFMSGSTPCIDDSSYCCICMCHEHCTNTAEFGAFLHHETTKYRPYITITISAVHTLVR